MISAKAWSDFGEHIPLIRSFSFGSNLPPQHPLYPGEPIRYHYFFYFLVALLESWGVRLDWALNLMSATGLAFLLLLIYRFSYSLFSRRLAAILSVLFFLFNGSFSWLDYLKINNFALKSSIINLKSLSHFPSFGPWNGSLITAFWNLNIYTNQRHLAFSFALLLFLIYILYIPSRRFSLLTGFILGSLLLLNQAAFAIGLIFAGWFFLFRPRLRLPMAISIFGVLPWLYLYSFSSLVPPTLLKHIGFLTPDPPTTSALAKFWLYNIGLHLFLIPLGAVIAPRRSWILLPPLIIIFLIPNYWQLSPDLINNHKFFNFFLIIGQMFTAHLLAFFLSSRNWFFKLPALLLIFPLTLGGIVDFFPVKNDSLGYLNDVSSNPEAYFFARYTSPNSIVLNSYWFYHSASLAGRKVFNGYSYFTWSFGYNAGTREKLAVAIYAAPTRQAACRLLHLYNISYVELLDSPEGFIHPNWDLWKNQFTPIYRNEASKASIYSVSKSCSGS